MKAKYALVVLLVAALALVGTGCNKVTGGGSFTNEGFSNNGNKISFGFNAQPTNDDFPNATARGRFQLVDHGSKTKIHGTFKTTYGVPSEETGESASMFWGTCSINDGTDDIYFEVIATDVGKPGLGVGDYIVITIGQYPALYSYQGTLEGGNIQVHKAKKK